MSHARAHMRKRERPFPLGVVLDSDSFMHRAPWTGDYLCWRRGDSLAERTLGGAPQARLRLANHLAYVHAYQRMSSGED